MAEKRGWCPMHYRRWQRHGDPDRGRPTMEERFWSKVDRTVGTSACWPWQRGRFEDGYGMFSIHPRTMHAHRVAYELLVGPIPDGLTLDHLCRNRACVNPAHLEPVTVQENLRRGIGQPALNSRKTHCKNGHPFDAENTVRFGPPGRDWRKCLTCIRDYDREWKRRQRANRKLLTK